MVAFLSGFKQMMVARLKAHFNSSAKPPVKPGRMAKAMLWYLTVNKNFSNSFNACLPQGLYKGVTFPSECCPVLILPYITHYNHLIASKAK
jgi:hypothetical protein